MDESRAILKLFQNSEFTYWAHREGLHNLEGYFMDNFLDNTKNILEGGCGGGFLLSYLHSKGFSNLSGFDFNPDFVSIAQKKYESKNIHFIVADASFLPYQDAQFDQVIYFGQLLSFISDPEKRQTAILEVKRILKPNGIFLLDLLPFEMRWQSPSFRIFLYWIKFLRLLRMNRKSIKYQPLMRRNHQFYWKAVFDKGPHFYWYKTTEAIEWIENAGFNIFFAAYLDKKRNMKELDLQYPRVMQCGSGLFIGCKKSAE